MPRDVTQLERQPGARPYGGTSVRPFDSSDEAVGAVGILLEVLGVAARISTPMLRKEHAVRVVCPTWTSPPYIIGAKALRKVSTAYCAANVFDEPAMSQVWHPRHQSPSRPRHRSVGGMSGRSSPLAETGTTLRQGRASLEA